LRAAGSGGAGPAAGRLATVAGLAPSVGAVREIDGGVHGDHALPLLFHFPMEVFDYEK
jgi:hypothetical protein